MVTKLQDKSGCVRRNCAIEVDLRASEDKLGRVIILSLHLEKTNNDFAVVRCRRILLCAGAVFVGDLNAGFSPCWMVQGWQMLCDIYFRKLSAAQDAKTTIRKTLLCSLPQLKQIPLS